MEEQLRKTIEEVRANAKCKSILIMSSDKAVLKMINNMNLENVKIVPTELLGGKYKGLFDGGKIYILPDHKNDQVHFYLDDRIES